MRTIIIEDSDKDLAYLKNLLQAFPQVQLVATATSVADGMAQVAALGPDLLLLDIELQGGTGFDLLQALGAHAPKTVFVTAYDGYAIQAFRFAALDYLLKPIKPMELAASLLRAQTALNSTCNQQHTQLQLSIIKDFINKADKTEHRLILMMGNEMRVLYPKDIMYYEASGSYTHFFLNSGEKLVAAQGLYNYQHLLDGYGFVKTSRQAVVNLAYVKSLKPEHGIHELTLLDGHTKLHVSRLCLETVKDGILGHRRGG
jgi:two-component system LytT family response regulator